jgi:hypothetical protein
LHGRTVSGESDSIAVPAAQVGNPLSRIREAQDPEGVRFAAAPARTTLDL